MEHATGIITKLEVLMLCLKCSKDLPESSFYKKYSAKTERTLKRTRSGTGYHSYCKKCLINYQNERWRQRKIKAIGYKGGKCIKCGYSRCIEVLEFHHRDASKKEFSGDYIKSMAWDKVKKEIDKCDLLCANCHREIHYAYRYELLVSPPGIEPGSNH